MAKANLLPGQNENMKVSFIHLDKSSAIGKGVRKHLRTHTRTGWMSLEKRTLFVFHGHYHD